MAVLAACASSSADEGFDVIIASHPVAGEMIQVHGHVFDGSSGKPIAGAKILVRCDRMSTPRELVTDTAGNFHDWGFPPGRCVVCGSDGSTWAHHGFDSPAGQRVNVRLKLDLRYHWPRPAACAP